MSTDNSSRAALIGKEIIESNQRETVKIFFININLQIGSSAEGFQISLVKVTRSLELI